ncbi:MAG: hypothetical protein JZD41_04690 [Thermoproteus sp.]|nr:hypothetical protein [Thermoproteus sp.]
MRRPLKFYDIAAGRAFTTDRYEVKEVEIKYRGRPPERRLVAVAKSPYTGVECYSFAPSRYEIPAGGLDKYL